MTTENLILTDEEVRSIEDILGYKFLNKKLLFQAFTRKVDNVAYDNDKLEHFGDRKIYNYIADYLIESESYMENGYFCTRSVKELTQFTSYWTCKLILASKVIDFNLDRFFLPKNHRSEYSKDIKCIKESTEIQSKRSICEDLFEAIVGAVYIDSRSNDAVKRVLDKILNPQNDNKYFMKNEFCILKEFTDNKNNNLYLDIVDGRFFLKYNDEIIYDEKCSSVNLDEKLQHANKCLKLIKGLINNNSL